MHTYLYVDTGAFQAVSTCNNTSNSQQQLFSADGWGMDWM